MIEAKFVLGGLKAVLDRPTMTLDFRKLFDGRSLRRPGCEEGKVAVRDLAADQETARPDLAFEGLAVLGRVKIGEFDIGPIMQALAFRSRARGQFRPSRRRKTIGDLFRRSGDDLRLVPGMKRLVGLHPEHIPFAGAAQRHLDVADAIDRIGGDEGEGNFGGDGALDHGERQRRLGREAALGASDHLLQHMRFGYARLVVGPAFDGLERC